MPEEYLLSPPTKQAILLYPTPTKRYYEIAIPVLGGQPGNYYTDCRMVGDDFERIEPTTVLSRTFSRLILPSYEYSFSLEPAQ